MFPLEVLYRSNKDQALAVMFDLRFPGSAESLHWARAVWQERSDIEALDQNHFVLIVRTNDAERPLV